MFLWFFLGFFRGGGREGEGRERGKRREKKKIYSWLWFTVKYNTIDIHSPTILFFIL